jgi:glycosyltransferase involved in cell wall biosynthesis
VALRLSSPRPTALARRAVRSTLVPALRYRALRRLSRLRPDEVTIVTVNWDSLPYLQVLVRLVRERSPASVHVRVVDNGSSDGSRKFGLHDPRVSLLKLPFNVGHELALDIGFLLAETEYVVALDIDAFPLHERWLDELLAPLSQGFEISGARLNREYVHPCCLAMRTARFVQQKHSFRSHYRPRSDGRDASGDVGEEMAAREAGKLYFFDRTSQRGPGDVGTVFGGLVYHNFYSTRFQATHDVVLDGRVAASDAAEAWEEALERYGA